MEEEEERSRAGGIGGGEVLRGRQRLQRARQLLAAEKGTSFRFGFCR